MLSPINFMKESFLEFKYNEDGKIVKVKVLITKVIEYLIKEYKFKTVFGSKSEEIWVYQDGIYKNEGREIIQTQTEKVLEEYCTNHNVKEIVEKVKRLTAISKEEFNNPKEELICIENGIINLKTQEFMEHSPKYYFKNKLPIIYDKEANCPIIRKFLDEILYPEDLKTMQEWFGFCIYKKYFIKKAMILFGNTDTGKTVLLNLLMSFLGEKNISGISLQRIAAGDKFALASLKDKFANIFDDLSSRDLIAGGFKVATGGGYITAEHKFGDSFQFLTFAKHIFATNKIPPIKDIDSDDMAYYSRWMPIPLDNQIDEENQDQFLLGKITTKEELSGLLNYALQGLQRLLKNGKFSFNKTPEDVKEIMERHGNPLIAFCQDILIRKDGNKISKDLMYELQSIYAKEKKLKRLSKEQLGRRLGKILDYVVAKVGGGIRYWENVSINPNIDKNIIYTFINTYREKKSIDNNIYIIFQEAYKGYKNGGFIDKKDVLSPYLVGNVQEEPEKPEEEVVE